MLRRPVRGGLPSNAWETLRAWAHTTDMKPPATHVIARLLMPLQQSGVDTTDLLPLRTFSTVAVHYRYIDEPEELSLDRISCCKRAEGLIDQEQELIS